MTPTARPNLGGLFNGSTAPDRSSGVADALGPRLILSPPLVEANDDSPSAESDARPEAKAQSDEAGLWAELDWLDPVKAMETYFGFLQAVLDAHRELGMRWANAVRSLPGRVGIHRH